MEALTARARPALATIHTEGRGGGVRGEGSGFVVSEDGLVVTNLHVIGQARPIRVTLEDGSEHAVTAVHASDRKLDLAVLKIDADGLESLPLGDGEDLDQGEDVIALGNPRGLAFSVVRGVVSAFREIDGNRMIQLAIPIEQGNSGGPLLDREGKVQGVMTMKSTVTRNLGFAMPVAALKVLMEKPNPIPIDDWLTIGALDPARWTPVMGADWTQHAGTVRVREPGSGFGGRSLCLSSRKVPDLPYELAVEVRLDDEAGAAGLVFSSDGGEVHYGFYPTGGQLRLTRFDGPVVYDWAILETVPVPSYREGDWNRLRVRIDKKKIRCFVNGELAIESDDTELREGAVGLCKFRSTEAEFRNFRVGKDLRPKALPKEIVDRLHRDLLGPATALPERFRLESGELESALANNPEAARALLEAEATRLESGAASLRGIAAQIHDRQIERQLAEELAKPEDQISLFRAGLSIARVRNQDLQSKPYLESLDRMARDVGDQIPKDKSDDRSKLEALSAYLFTHQGFHGSRFDYYNPSNSFLNEVIDDREGLPITLSVLYLELADRIGVERIHGIPLPGHFMVGYLPKESGEMELIDPFNGGSRVTHEEAAEIIFKATGAPFDRDCLKPATKHEIVARMLTNLIGVHFEEEPPGDALAYLNLYLAITPEDHGQRFARGFLRYRASDFKGALADLRHVRDHAPVDAGSAQMDRLESMIAELEQRLAE